MKEFPLLHGYTMLVSLEAEVCIIFNFRRSVIAKTTILAPAVIGAAVPRVVIKSQPK